MILFDTSWLSFNLFFLYLQSHLSTSNFSLLSPKNFHLTSLKGTKVSTLTQNPNTILPCWTFSIPWPQHDSYFKYIRTFIYIMQKAIYGWRRRKKLSNGRKMKWIPKEEPFSRFPLCECVCVKFSWTIIKRRETFIFHAMGYKFLFFFYPFTFAYNVC